MKYSQILFGKDLYELEYDDLVQFFNEEKEETLNLEFKSYPPQGNHNDKENAVFKAICGLLNSEGGIIIWGAPTEESDAQGNTTAHGALTPFTTILDRDRLINKISSLIIPLPFGIRVQKLNDANDASVFVIEVEKSSQKPHQFKSHYYIRLDGQTKIAPHYLISAMMKSIDFPIIRGHLRLKSIVSLGNRISFGFRKVLFNTSEFNNDLNVFFRIIASPGILDIGGQDYQGDYQSNLIKVFSKGTPRMSSFNLIVPSNLLIKNGHEIRIILSFGGEKSPSKVSSYIYNFANIAFGDVADENIFLTEKKENKLPSDSTSKTADESINDLLNL